MLTSITVTRRNLLQGASVASAYLLSGRYGQHSVGGVRPAVASGPATLTMDDAVVTTVKHFDGSWTEEVHAAFPVRFGISERTDPLTMTAQWDSRLFAVRGPMFAIDGDNVTEVSLSQPDSGTFSAEIPATATEVVLQVETFNTYPGDNLADVAPTRLSLTSADGELIDEYSVASSVVPSAPWSVEVSVDWISYDKIIVPARLGIISIGPNAAPAGLEVLVAYADVLGAATVAIPDGVDAPPATLRANSIDGIAELTLTTDVGLAPESQVEVTFTVEESDSVPRPFDGFVPYVRLSPLSDPTGMRMSDRHSSYPVTASGSQLSSYLPAPNAG